MKRYGKVLLFLCVSLFSLINIIEAQNDTVWFDYRWKETTQKNAVYFRPQPQLLKDGRYLIIDYYRNGSKQYEYISVTNDDNDRNGLCKVFYRKDEADDIQHFKAGSLGNFLSVKDTSTKGLLEGYVNYKDGFPEGISYNYYRGGKLKEKRANHNRTYKSTVYTKEGKILNKIDYAYGSTTSLNYSYYPSKKLKSVQTFKNNILNGLSTTYYENGKPESKGNYTDGIKTGKWNYWNKSGQQTTKNESDMILEESDFYNMRQIDVDFTDYFSAHTHIDTLSLPDDIRLYTVFVSPERYPLSSFLPDTIELKAITAYDHQYMLNQATNYHPAENECMLLYELIKPPELNIKPILTFLLGSSVKNKLKSISESTIDDIINIYEYSIINDDYLGFSAMKQALYNAK